MMKHKIFLLFLCTLLMLSCFSLWAFAEDVTEEVTAAPLPIVTIDPILEQRKQELLDSTTQMNLSYTLDSISADGIYIESYIDPFTYLGYIHIVTSDIPLGVQIYDDPTTDIIDGIRINGETIDSLRMIPVDPTVDKYEILVKTEYKNNILGDFAKINDGKYTVDDLVKNPLLTLQVVYYLFLIVSAVVAVFIGMRSKKKKVRTANEIAEAVNISAASVNTAAAETKILIADLVKDMLNDSILPIMQKTIETNQSIVKSIIVSNSKNKDAPLALLDIFKDVSDIDTNKLLSEARDSVEKNLSKESENKKQLLAALKNIAEPTQEEKSNVQEKPKETKSIF